MSWAVWVSRRAIRVGWFASSFEVPPVAEVDAPAVVDLRLRSGRRRRPMSPWESGKPICSSKAFDVVSLIAASREFAGVVQDRLLHSDLAVRRGSGDLVRVDLAVPVMGAPLGGVLHLGHW